VTASYPLSFDEIGPWTAAAGVTADEARVRFAQYAVLRSIAAVRPLRDGLVFKGGNALDFVWRPNRSTVDLDFSVDHASNLAMPDAKLIRRLLERGIPIASTQLGVMLKVHRVQPNPRGTDKDFVTFAASMGYALPDEERLRQRMAQGEPSSHAIKLDISLNEPIGADRLVQMASELQLRVATIEDIVAEKLRALLQQPIRNRQRRQDLLDIAVILRGNIAFDRCLVAEFLLLKAAARNVPVTRAGFRSPEVVSRAGADYAELEGTTRILFVPLEEALALLNMLVDELDIPES
jgi:predicted nucleotidyltransferase component of viral defense system